MDTCNSSLPTWSQQPGIVGSQLPVQMGAVNEGSHRGFENPIQGWACSLSVEYCLKYIKTPGLISMPKHECTHTHAHTPGFKRAGMFKGMEVGQDRCLW